MIVAFATIGSEASLAEIARDAHVALTLVEPILPGRYALVLASAERDPECAAAITRLARDPRVQSVALDSRRDPHGGD